MAPQTARISTMTPQTVTADDHLHSKGTQTKSPVMENHSAVDDSQLTEIDFSHNAAQERSLSGDVDEPSSGAMVAVYESSSEMFGDNLLQQYHILLRRMGPGSQGLFESEERKMDYLVMKNVLHLLGVRDAQKRQYKEIAAKYQRQNDTLQGEITNKLGGSGTLDGYFVYLISTIHSLRQDNALSQHIIATHERSEKKLQDQNSWLKGENSRLAAMLNATQDHIADSDGEPPKKKRREEVPISEKDLDGEAIQRRGSEEVE